MLYTGKSYRARGWLSNTLGDMGPSVNRSPLRWPIIKRFDGAARCCSGWDNLGRDPELWYRNGNCYVHLYAKGELQRGPSFRVPLSCLLDARCHPLIEKFIERPIDRSIFESEEPPEGRVDLYIPAPCAANQLQAYWYHLAIRNLFAWVFRRSVVGEHLGYTLITLANTLAKFRQPGADNMHDLLAYLDEEGYLDTRDQPTHALAILHLAENFTSADLYLEAFPHCVGMSDRLHKHNEYSRISSASRKLIRHARVDMDFRLSRAGTMLGDLLQEELSEAHLGLPAAARAHLDRFRTYVHGFYTTRFGSFPPVSSNKKCGTIFDPTVYRTMQADFAALYEYLVDFSFTPDLSSRTTQGGLCALQLVQEFDCRHKFLSLPHPVPLLPDPIKPTESRKRSSIAWLVGGPAFREAKGRPNQRLLSYAALMKATNHSNPSVLRNRLVVAYRQFEEDSLFTAHKAESSERLGVSPADARKVRWLFVYAVYQTLLSCAESQSKLNFDSDGLAYHLNVSTLITLPWDADGKHFAVTSLEGHAKAKPSSPVRPAERNRTVSPIPLLPPILSPTEKIGQSHGLNIKPDVDYFALTHPKAESSPTETFPSGGLSDGFSEASRATTLTRGMSIRKPLSRFCSVSSQKLSINTSPTNSVGRAAKSTRGHIYHEIIVHGYGNGTHEVSNVSAETSPVHEDQVQPVSPMSSTQTDRTATRSDSLSSKSSYRSAQSRSSVGPSDFSSTPTSPMLPAWKQLGQGQSETTESIADSATLYEDSLGDKPSYTDLKTVSTTALTRSSSLRKMAQSMYSNDDMLLASSVAEPPPLPRKSSKRGSKSNTGANGRWSMLNISAALHIAEMDDSGSDYASDDETEAGSALHPRPLRIHKTTTLLERETIRAKPSVIMELAEIEEPLQIPDDWEQNLQSNGLVPASPCLWEQFDDLGGLQPMQ